MTKNDKLPERVTLKFDISLLSSKTTSSGRVSLWSGNYQLLNSGDLQRLADDHLQLLPRAY